MGLVNEFRDTEYYLYQIGAVDPQYKHIWGFETAEQRDTFLKSNQIAHITNCKYWKQGESIKVNCSNQTGFSFENSYRVDYVKIVNRPNTEQEKVYYCFVTDRKYKNLNCTELKLDIDFVQTYYFNYDNTPFWETSGYGIATTDLSVMPLRGMGSEYPALAKRNLWQWHTNNDNIAFVIYSTIDISARFSDPTYEVLTYDNDPYTDPIAMAGLIDNVYMGAKPYFINCGSTEVNSYALKTLNSDMNNSGQLGSITGIYCIPAEISPIVCNQTTGNLQAIKAIDHEDYDPKTLIMNVPLADTLFNAQGIDVVNPILKGYDYTNIIVSNQTGEEQIFRYEDFTGAPQFEIVCSFASGYPCLICSPRNYKFGVNNQKQLFAMKQTMPPNCSMNSDNYAIWQAQNRNSIDAGRSASQLTVDNAKEAQAKSGGVASMLDTMFEKAGDSLSSLLPNLGLTEEMQNALTTSGYSGLNSLLSMGFMSSFGLEASYTYKQNVKVAEQALKTVEAGYADKKYLPNTSTGSNAYGDLMMLKQYGFNISVVAPSNDDLIDIDRINESSGHMCKGLLQCRKTRKIFDYCRMIEPKLTNYVYSRPQFVNNMMCGLFNDGIYLWWYDETRQNIDTLNFAHPYAILNEAI